MMPNYIIIGTAKAATSSLAVSLGQHPNIFMVDCKEACFFSHDDIYARGLDWYQSLYAASNGKKMRGEASPSYTMKECYPKTIERIAKHAPDAKLIYTVRHPLKRIQSFWVQKRATGSEGCHYDFTTSVRLNRDLLIDPSNYLSQVDSYRKYFSDEQILILFFEDYRAEPDKVLRRCYEFLGVDPEFVLPKDSKHLNPSIGKPVVRPEFSKVRSKWYYKTGKALMPAGMRETVLRQKWFKKIKFERSEGLPEWDEETRQWAIEQLAGDSVKFLQRYGKPADFWSFD